MIAHVSKIDPLNIEGRLSTRIEVLKNFLLYGITHVVMYVWFATLMLYSTVAAKINKVYVGESHVNHLPHYVIM